MSPADTELYNLALTYSSREDFKAKNLPKYLVAKRKGLLQLAFPLALSVPSDILKGIYYLYQDTKLMYIGNSLVDVEQAIDNHKSEGIIPFNNYKIFTPYSDSDILVLTLYLSNKSKPRYNTNIGKNTLTVYLPDLWTVLGKPTKGTI